MRVALTWAACGGRLEDDFPTARTVQDKHFRRRFGFFKMPRIGSSSKTAAMASTCWDLEELVPTSPAVDSSQASGDETEESTPRRQSQRGVWAEWCRHRDGGANPSECAERNRLDEPLNDQSGCVSILSHRNWSFPTAAPPPPLEHPSEVWKRSSTGKGLREAIKELHKDGTVTSQWITCGNSQDVDQEGEMGLGRYLELLRKLEMKNKKRLILTFLDAQVYQLKGFLVSRLLESLEPEIAACLYSPQKLRNRIQSEILAWLPEGEEY